MNLSNIYNDDFDNGLIIILMILTRIIMIDFADRFHNSGNWDNDYDDNPCNDHNHAR